MTIAEDAHPGDDVVNYWGRVHDERRLSVGTLRHLGEKTWVNEDADITGLAVRLLAPAEAGLSRWEAG